MSSEWTWEISRWSKALQRNRCRRLDNSSNTVVVRRTIQNGHLMSTNAFHRRVITPTSSKSSNYYKLMVEREAWLWTAVTTRWRRHFRWLSTTLHPEMHLFDVGRTLGSDVWICDISHQKSTQSHYNLCFTSNTSIFEESEKTWRVWSYKQPPSSDIY